MRMRISSFCLVTSAIYKTVSIRTGYRMRFFVYDLMEQFNRRAEDVDWLLEELKTERNGLDLSFVHCLRWLQQGEFVFLVFVRSPAKSVMIPLATRCLVLNFSSPTLQKSRKRIVKGILTVPSIERRYIPQKDQESYNLLGRLFGPRGLTLQRMETETGTKMTVLGRGSMQDKLKEEELRNSDEPDYLHLNDDLHVLIVADPPYAS